MYMWRLLVRLAVLYASFCGLAASRELQESSKQVGQVIQSAGSAVSAEGKIPHILHYIYLSGFDAYVTETERPRAKMQRWYRESCVEVHKHWEIMFWTEEMANNLVETHFKEFLPIWRTYDMEVHSRYTSDGRESVMPKMLHTERKIELCWDAQVKRADVIRAFILLHHGGMYLDLDNECYRPAEEVFKNYDVVLQGTGFEGVNNGMMASAPGHPLWHAVLNTLKERYKGSDIDPWKNNPIYMTGPAVLTHTVQKYLKLSSPVSGFLGTLYYVDDTIVKIYSIGEFFVPCWGADLICIKRFEKEKANGKWDMSTIVGRHWFAGSWNKPWLLNKDGRPKDRTLLKERRRQRRSERPRKGIASST